MSEEWDPALYIWTIFDKGTDGDSENYTARMFEVQAGQVRATGDVIHSVDIDYVRMMFQRMGLVPLTRSDGDEPHIIESWL